MYYGAKYSEICNVEILSILNINSDFAIFLSFHLVKIVNISH